mmetsp:Transcript_48428/g.102998  ORF Transcript_48428/g.102998 Transcript_48428/m.102998 type:complete len:184 (-) Transcript_48428:515-1066(-)
MKAHSALESDGHIQDYVVFDLSGPPMADGKGVETPPCEYLVRESYSKHGRQLTAVVNCAGVIQTGNMGEVTVENYDYNMITNTRVPFEIMTHAVPFLKTAAAGAKSNGEGKDDEHVIAPSIVNISSVCGKQSFPGCTAYCMSKAAVDMMARCASVDLAKHGIRVNNVNPGMVVTELHQVSFSS